MDTTSFHARVDAERGRGTIRSRSSGDHLLPCCWTECEHNARREHLVGIPDGERVTMYFFCTERHRDLWINSPKDFGNLPGGSRGMVT